MTDDKVQRKQTPIASGCTDYFPDALAAVARVSFVGAKQHNPDGVMRWDRSKSPDHADCLMRHLLERGTVDTDGLPHSAKVAWRALALLQVELENAMKEKNAGSDTLCGAVYLAGPMRGYPKLNYPAFHAAAALGRSYGYIIVSPAERDLAEGIDPNRSIFTKEECREFARKDLALIFECAAVAVLPNWEKSMGAKTEVALAEWLSLPLLDATTFKPLVKA